MGNALKFKFFPAGNVFFIKKCYERMIIFCHFSTLLFIEEVSLILFQQIKNRFFVSV